MTVKPAIAAFLAAFLLAWGSPALAQDDDGLEDPNACAAFNGGTVPPGTVIVVSTGFPVPPGVPPSSDGSTSIWYCDGGHWVYGGTVAFQPPLRADAPSVEVPEGTTATMTGTYANDDASLVTFSSSIGTATPDTESTWSWSATPDDGSADTQQVLITSTDGDKQVTASFELDVTNVAPTATALTPSTTVALVGQPVTFTGTATDPSNADTAAGFSWDVSGGSTQSFDACGRYTVNGTATDKDSGVSDPITSGPVNIVAAGLEAPIVAGSRNVVQAGRVVPVRLTVGCGTTTLSGLSPAITLLSGDVDPDTSSDDPATLVPVVSASAADASGVMREVGGSYLYNLKVPQAPSGSRFTIRVRPVSGAVVQAVLEVR
jgi:hypothetical protein